VNEPPRLPRNPDPPPWLDAVAAGGPFRGYCHVIDGDTIMVRGVKVRIFGIDAPELDRPFGQKAKWAMISICKRKMITVVPNGETSYDRIVGECRLPDGTDIAAELVKMGLAVDWPQFSGGRYRGLEHPHAARRLGIVRVLRSTQPPSPPARFDLEGYENNSDRSAGSSIAGNGMHRRDDDASSHEPPYRRPNRPAAPSWRDEAASSSGFNDGKERNRAFERARAAIALKTAIACMLIVGVAAMFITVFRLDASAPPSGEEPAENTAAARIMRFEVTASTLRVRSCASLDCEVQGGLVQGTPVEGLEFENGWVRISEDGAWVSARYLKPLND